MVCPICDQKPMNCDCTPEERRQYCEIEELQDEIARLRRERDDSAVAKELIAAGAEIARLRLTDAEREAVQAAITYIETPVVPTFLHRHAATLRGLLGRTAQNKTDGYV